MNIQAPKGTKDILPPQTRLWQYVEKTMRDTAALYSFEEIRFPAFEHTELFLRGVGETTDVVQKEMYTFNDKGGRSITLRPEGTASVVRAFVEHNVYADTLPFKCYYIAPNFRYERPQHGRLRQHHQFGVECFGAALPAADAEVIALAHSVLRGIGVERLTLNINSVGCPACRPAYQKELLQYFTACKDKLCETCLTRLENNPLRILDCKTPSCGELKKNAPKSVEHLCTDCSEHLSSVTASLDEMGIGYTLNTLLVRGLDYYTRTVFEFVTTLEGGELTVCAGGRYDGLVAVLGGPSTPAVGFGMGIERLILLMEASQTIPDLTPENTVFVAVADSTAQHRAHALASELRQLQVSCDIDLCSRSLKAQMRYADKKKASYVIVLGQRELEENKIKIKFMSDGRTIESGLDAAEIATLINPPKHIEKSYI